MNPETTPTPRTDFLAHLGMMHNEYIDRMTMLSRNLERELTDKTSEVARLRELLERVIQIADEFWKNQKQAVTVWHYELADELQAIRDEIQQLKSK